ncbi:hypothetical protein TWF281_001212 [Arthrobotrys megalospora]
MSDLSKNPLAASNTSSSNLNQGNTTSTTGLSQVTGVMPRQTDVDWNRVKQAGSKPPLQIGTNPPQGHFSTDTVGNLGVPQNNVQIAQAALGFDLSGINIDGFNGEAANIGDFDFGPQMDPSLIIQPPPGNNQFGFGSLDIHDDNIDAEGSIDGQDHPFQPSLLAQEKRKESGASPAQAPQAKRIRTTNIAEELQTPLPPASAIQSARHFKNVTTPSGAHRIALQSTQSASRQMSPNLSEMAHEREVMRKQCEYLEMQLLNRITESSRQAEEIQRANQYAARAKVCMFKDGTEVNRLKALLISTKERIEAWRGVLEQAAVLQSPPTRDNDNDAQENTPAKWATAIMDDSEAVLKNINKVIAEVYDRPVHELDGVVETHAKFDHDIGQLP